MKPAAVFALIYDVYRSHAFHTDIPHTTLNQVFVFGRLVPLSVIPLGLLAFYHRFLLFWGGFLTTVILGNLRCSCTLPSCVLVKFRLN